ncbi:MAG: amidohydrolase family protein [Caldilineaceae bacterium]|nr:amidohydrolase family protein [Caldilineaceae bacterium]
MRRMRVTQIQLPGLVDAHVHLREPGYTHKEDFTTGTAAALAGGVTTVLDMPNTVPSTATPETLAEKVTLAAAKAVCDVGIFVGATSSALDAYLPVAHRACGLKIYVNDTFGNLRIDELSSLHRLFRTWAERASEVGGFRSERSPSPASSRLGPIAVHAEDLMVPVCLYLSDLYDIPLHIVHVSRRSEIELIRAARERGSRVTCEASPHHLFLSTADLPRLGARGDMRPRLATPDDVAALWENLDVIDIFATDHAPHTLAEKASETPPPGVPGVETMLPLLLTAVHAGWLELADIVERCVDAPRRIYALPEQPETIVDVDVDAESILRDEDMHTKAGWTPFAGMPVFGLVERVTLRGRVVYEDGFILAQPGSGQVLFQHS